MIDKSAIDTLAKAEAITAAHSAMTSMAEAVTALPNDFTVHDLEPYLLNRRRARGIMVTSDAAHFATYVDDQQQAGASVFVDADQMRAIAVLNLGIPDDPGHADNTAELKLRQTAAYAALLAIATGRATAQKDVAEFLEDWHCQVECFNDAGDVPVPKAIAAVRAITIEGLKKVAATEAQLSASRSSFEQIQATSEHPIPTTINFACTPYLGLPPRKFGLRLSIITGDKPMISLRLVMHELHREEMAREFAALVTQAVDGKLPVLVGTYTPKK